MFEWLYQIAGNTPYVVIFGLILASGLGLPIPEDISLVLAGYLCGHDYADPWIMFPGAFACIVGADALVFLIGRRYGHHVPKLPLLRRYLTEPRLAKTEGLLHRHGGKFIFAARFLPGLRAAAMFTAGVFKIPIWKFLLYDGSAALISVPLILSLSYRYANELDRARQWIAEGRVAAIAVLVLIVATIVLIKLRMARRLTPGKTP